MAISTRDYWRIKRSMERMASNQGMPIASREYQWMYDKRKGLVRLAKFDSELDKAIEGLAAYTSVCTLPQGSKALAHVHNHPNGSAVPSFSDLETLLKIARHNDTRHGIIAMSQKGIVPGFCETEYTGDSRQIDGVIMVPSAVGKTAMMERFRDVNANPNKYPHITGSTPIFTDCLH